MKENPVGDWPSLYHMGGFPKIRCTILGVPKNEECVNLRSIWVPLGFRGIGVQAWATSDSSLARPGPKVT